ncbi:MAG: AEC family transporter [Candidatus Azobacteroides sp.]|nr:AEC family transporter [Candidatus Azobacteroides sp.]
MENFFFSVNVVAPLFFMMVAGYLAHYLKLVNDSFLTEANKFVFKLALPFMLFQNIRLTFHGDFPDSKLIISSLAGIVITILISFMIVPLFVKRSGQRGSIIQGIYRSNFLIYGIPLATGMYGKEAMGPVSVLMGTTIPAFNIAAVIILSVYSETETKKLSFKRIILDIIHNPLIIGCFFGMIFGLLHIKFPPYIDKPIDELVGIATPLALFVMGGDFKFRSLQNNIWKVLATTLARLVIVPGLAMAIFVPMGFRNLELSALLCLFATPTAVSSYIMAKNMGVDAELSGQIVVLTTVCSCVTIFFFVFALRSMGFL